MSKSPEVTPQTPGKNTLPIVHPTANDKKEVSPFINEMDNQFQNKQRTFTMVQKQECWNRAAIMLGRNPDRFRLDAVGNPVCRVLTNCLGPLCHEYDHIYPFSKGGTTTIENCQILQSTVNRVKSNRVDITYNEMKAASPKVGFTGVEKLKINKLDEELDVVERAVYGNVQKIDMKFHFDRQSQSQSKKAKDEKPQPGPKTDSN